MIKRALKIAVTAAIFFFASAFTVLPTTEYSLTIYAGEREYVFRYPEIDYAREGLYLKNLDGILERIYLDTRIKAIDAKANFTPNAANPFIITSESMGREIDVDDLKKKILEAIAVQNPTVNALFVDVRPAVTADELKECTYLRAVFSTDYSYSEAGRKRNISLAANAISGAVIKSGEEFSFNAAVGERNSERGYSEAKIIQNGKYVTGVGGGVCQVSTTLYNAALLACVNVSERHPHSIAVSYVEPSFDAMVSGSNCDLRLVNCTGGPIFIAAKADGNRLQIKIYGKKNEYVVKRISVTLKSADPGYDIVDEGEADDDGVISYSKPEITSMGKLQYYSGNNLVKTLPLGKDCYSGVKGTKIKKPPESHIIKDFNE